MRAGKSFRGLEGYLNGKISLKINDLEKLLKNKNFRSGIKKEKLQEKYIQNRRYIFNLRTQIVQKQKLRM